MKSLHYFTARKSFLLSISLFVALLIGLTNIQAHAQNERFVEGEHYVLLDKILPTQSGDKIEIAEMFWYRCPHCYELEPYIKKWQENIPENANLVFIPAIFSDRWEFSARAFYTFEALGLVDALGEKYYHALHEEKRKIRTVEVFAAWVAANGGNADDVINTFNSFAVENKINFAKSITINSGATGVPTILINGRYRTNVSMAGSAENLIELINFMIDKIAQERTS